MTADSAVLEGFAYGEHLEGPAQRSLGYRLLAPGEAAPWGTEEEALARRLHAAPYPHHRPAAGLRRRLWAGGALLSAARARPDRARRGGLLEGAAGHGGWLPLPGAGFPLAAYARRGPGVAWTPHRAGGAVKGDHNPADTPTPA